MIGFIGMVIITSLAVSNRLDIIEKITPKQEHFTETVLTTQSSNIIAPTKININRASFTEIQSLPGIGPKKADMIIKARAILPFRKPTDLRRVKGIGEKTIKRLLPYIQF